MLDRTKKAVTVYENTTEWPLPQLKRPARCFNPENLNIQVDEGNLDQLGQRDHFDIDRSSWNCQTVSITSNITM